MYTANICLIPQHGCRRNGFLSSVDLSKWFCYCFVSCISIFRRGCQYDVLCIHVGKLFGFFSTQPSQYARKMLTTWLEFLIVNCPSSLHGHDTWEVRGFLILISVFWRKALEWIRRLPRHQTSVIRFLNTRWQPRSQSSLLFELEIRKTRFCTGKEIQMSLSRTESFFCFIYSKKIKILRAINKPKQPAICFGFSRANSAINGFCDSFTHAKQASTQCNSINVS